MNGGLVCPGITISLYSVILALPKGSIAFWITGISGIIFSILTIISWFKI